MKGKHFPSRGSWRLIGNSGSTKAERVMDSEIDARDYFSGHCLFLSARLFFMFICLTLVVACEFRTKIDVMLI
jgi:hypothetical protein